MDASPPIPPPLDSDDEDVYLALSTARTLWNRGERDDALRWLRRAAEKASDADEDARALDLFKAAAELSSKMAAAPAVTVATAPPAPPIPRASTPPPPAVGPPGAYTAARPSAPPPLPTAAKAAPPPLPRAAPPQAAQPPLQQPSGRRGTRTGGRAPAPPPGVRAAPAAVPQPVQSAPPPQTAVRAPAAQPPAVRPRIDSPAQRDAIAPPSAAAPSAGRPPMRPASTDKMSAVRHDPSQPPPSAYVHAVHNQGTRPSAAPAPPPTVRAAATPAAAAPATRATAAPAAAAARGATPARAASTSGGRRRTVNQRSPFYEDEVTAQRQMPIQPQPRVLPDLVEGTTADGEEATAILQGGLLDGDPSAKKQVVEQAVQQAIARAAAAKREEPQAAEVVTSAPATAGLIRTPVPAAAPQQPAQEAAPRKSAWPATRVAVVKTAAGVQLMAMGQGDQAPAGSVVAVLIPMSEADGAALAQLLGTSA